MFLCEACAKHRFSIDLTDGIIQIWLRYPDQGWPGWERVKQQGFGPPCAICGHEKTTYEVSVMTHFTNPELDMQIEAKVKERGNLLGPSFTEGADNEEGVRE